MSAEDIQSSIAISDNEHQLALWLDRPFVSLAIGVVVLLMLVFLAGKAGFSLWLMSKIGWGERLVNEAGEPDFWSIRKELDVYQRPDGAAAQQVQRDNNVPAATPVNAAANKAAAAGKKERFNGRREHASDQKLLAALL